MTSLYQIISTVFCVIVILSNIISAKMVPIGPFCIPAGLLTYPLTFLLSDLVTEIFGVQKAKRMVYITLGMNVLTFGMLQMALLLPGHSVEEQQTFQAVLGLSGLRIFSSLTAYIVSQMVAIYVFAWVRGRTGNRFLWLRSNGSAWTSQVVDTLVIDLIFLYWGMGMSLLEVLPVMLFSIAYKAFFSLANTPLFYLSVFLVRRKYPLSA
jgi:queuosine precursor transporter